MSQIPVLIERYHIDTSRPALITFWLHYQDLSVCCAFVASQLKLAFYNGTSVAAMNISPATPGNDTFLRLSCCILAYRTVEHHRSEYIPNWYIWQIKGVVVEWPCILAQFVGAFVPVPPQPLPQKRRLPQEAPARQLHPPRRSGSSPSRV